MLERQIVREQLAHTLTGVDLPGLGGRYRGKVRDCYTVGDRRILVTTDRLSAFDVVLTTIPFKGALLNGMAGYWFDETKHLVRNHLLGAPHPNVFVTQQVEIIPIEIVVRGYLTGSAWRDYEAGNPVSGIKLPRGMKKHARLDKPVLTPSTKAPSGIHDEPISAAEILSRGIVERALWEEISERALALFDFGTRRALEHGLILVDTKYEFGLLRTASGRSELVLADEIHTQDSSRFWEAPSYEARFAAGEDPEMLDKEFVRRWLIAQGYMGEGTPPVFDDEFRIEVCLKYAEAFEQITGQVFASAPGPLTQSITRAVDGILAGL